MTENKESGCNYKNSLNAADRRIERVEQLKVDKGCAAETEAIQAKTEDLTQKNILEYERFIK